MAASLSRRLDALEASPSLTDAGSPLLDLLARVDRRGLATPSVPGRFWFVTALAGKLSPLLRARITAWQPELLALEYFVATQPDGPLESEPDASFYRRWLVALRDAGVVETRLGADALRSADALLTAPVFDVAAAGTLVHRAMAKADPILNTSRR